MKPTVELVYFNAGGGHRAAALALRDTLALQQRPWQLRLTNLTEVLDPSHRFKRWTGLAPEDLYNRRLARGWTLGLRQELHLLQSAIRLAHGPLCRRLAAHWRSQRPDLVVSLIPNFNRALGASLAQTRPGVPFATVMTDMADLPPRFWIEPAVHQHVICGTVAAQHQALTAGLPPERVSLVSGMLLRPTFYHLPPLDRAAECAALGLDPSRPVAAVMYGGQGSADMLEIARRLPDLQLILFTGHNQLLAQRLRSLPGRAARAVLGFTPEVPRLLRLADFFIGKPGPGCLSEALHLGLPVVTFDNAWTMPQERFNTRWVRDLGVGLVLRSLRELPEAVARLLPLLDAYRTRVAWLDNRAVFEVPEILDELLHGATAQPAAVRRDLDAVPASRAALALRRV
jgi:UDP-N-acetylglucosamine:LPS N-acetylglucosamine transferase